MVQPEKIDEVLRGSYRTSKLNTQVYAKIGESMSEFEEFINKFVDYIDIDIMPGEADFSNSFVPQ